MLGCQVRLQHIPGGAPEDRALETTVLQGEGWCGEGPLTRPRSGSAFGVSTRPSQNTGFKPVGAVGSEQVHLSTGQSRQRSRGPTRVRSGRCWGGCLPRPSPSPCTRHLLLPPGQPRAALAAPEDVLMDTTDHVLSLSLSLKCLFLRERQRQKETDMSRGGAEREGGTESKAGSPGSELSAQSPVRGW